MEVRKRDGRIVSFDQNKIFNAISKAYKTVDCNVNKNLFDTANGIVELIKEYTKDKLIDIERIQDFIEYELMKNGYHETAKQYILYRAERSKIRENKSRLMKTYDDIVASDASESDLKRENANIDGNTAMGAMLKFGSEGAKHYYTNNMLNPNHAKAHSEGDIHIHDLDFYSLTTTCTQIKLQDLFKNGFCTGHGTLREPNDIASYSALACIAIQSNQNDQHGGQSIHDFEYALAEGVRKTFIKKYRENLVKGFKLENKNRESANELVKTIIRGMEDIEEIPCLLGNYNYTLTEYDRLIKAGFSKTIVNKIQKFAHSEAERETDRATYQAMEALIHNLNTMHSRAGAQVPFSSINYGLDTSPEGRMVMKNILLSTERGLGNGETPIFPIQIFRVKEGINYNPEDPNYDLFKLAIRCSSKRLFPNFSFQDAPFNLKYYDPNNTDTQISYMGCRTRVMGNTYNPSKEIATGRGNLSFTSINLPRIAIEANKDIDRFYDLLDERIDLVIQQLLERFEVQARKKVKNYPFLMGQKVWIDSDKLKWNDEVREVLKHGTLSMGFIGLAEALTAMYGKHHAEDEGTMFIGESIVSYMRFCMDKASEIYNINFTLLATPAEGLSGRFVKLDREKYGIIPGVTDKEYYTNSFHVPVDFSISAFDKIKIEAPYHELTNAGHISYVELDGEASKNLEAYESIVRHMKECGFGYGSVNHPVDRDPVCGYNGILYDECPRCGRLETPTMPFERIRRITGYLVGTVDRFNDAKRAEERNRIKHEVK